MLIRAPESFDKLLNGRPYSELAGKTNLYPTAFPFDRGIYSSPAPVVPVALWGEVSGVTSEQTLWPFAFDRTWPTAAFTVAISSDDAADVLTTGTGAWTVEVDVLDTDYAAHTITMNLNGTTAVVDTTLAGDVIRVNDIRVVAVGTGLANAGNLYVFDSTDTLTAGVPDTDAKTFQIMPLGRNLCMSGVYTVPAGCMLQVSALRAGFDETSTTARAAQLKLRTRVLAGTKRISADLPVSGQITGYSGTLDARYFNGVTFPEKTDIELRAAASASLTVFAFADGTLFHV